MINRFRVGSRLAVAFALVVVLAGVTGGEGFAEIRVQAATAARLRALTALADDARQMQFHIADETGWQSFEGGDVAALGPAKALAPSSPNVKGFADSKVAIYALITHWHAAAMTSGEASHFSSLHRVWDAYFNGAEKVEKLWREGTPASYRLANAAMNTGFNSTSYVAVLDETMAIKSSVEKRRAALERSQASGSSRAQFVVIVTLVLALFLAAAAAVLVTRSVVKPLRHCVAALRAVAAGDLTARAVVIGSDELASLAVELNQSTENTGRAVASMVRTGKDLATNCDALTAAAAHGVDASRSANTECAQAAAGTSAVSAHIDGIAASTDQMGSAIAEISLNASQAATVAHGAVASAQQMTAVMNQLGQASSEISSVVKLIAAITSQTNLLALNATIEAARAGEAGKGFAVVATEVKELAAQTGGATRNITGQVQAMQNAVSGAVSAIERVSQTIDEISDFQTTIASAVEQQTATTSEINRSVVDASGAAATVTHSIAVAAKASTQTLEAIHGVSAVTTELAQLNAALQKETSRFTYEN